MKKLSFYITLFMTTLVMAACGGSDYEDWDDPQWNPQEDAITIPGFKASAVGAQDLNTITEETVPVFTLSTATLPAGYSLTDARIELTPTGDGVLNAGTTKLDATVDGTVTKAELQSLIETSFGKNPVARTFKAHVYVSAIKDGQAAYIDAGEIEVVVTPVKPDISSAYYVLGGTKGWDVAGAQSQKFDHSDTNVYDDPVFTITIPAAAGSDTWFAIAPEEALADGNVDWSKVLGTKLGNGKNGVGVTEQLDYRSNLSDDGSFMVSKDLNAAYIRITINMLDFTYEIKAVPAVETWYLIGGDIANGAWNNDAEHIGTSIIPMAYAGGSKITYTGYFAGNGFKLIKTPGSWDDQWGAGSNGYVKNDGGSGNITVPEAGWYKVTLDYANDVLTVDKTDAPAKSFEQVGIAGSFNGWTFAGFTAVEKSEGHTWYGEVTFSTGDQAKFLIPGWGTNWGAENFPSGTGVQNGANIPCEAGTYIAVINDIDGGYTFIKK